ncbi:hypothetical protein L0668_11460 [Paraglaciecola aquimarina]|uniref:Helicase ATP-binding domain-containing protein n=1 Tax=Paraglaciecola algarum TaxID=3050085 RepID=A0ABS9D9Q7_9ALTE|nr:hypothetical protein [Paraglaciecola sp. G1-23]MCF2948727.1 hypothetical protein [Paraglaciecola sp. G1-23]
MQIYYVDGVCGSGKTQTAIRKILDRIKAGETVVYATETKKLLEQTKEGLERLNVPCSIIVAPKQSSWRKNYKSVIEEIIKGISSASEFPHVILCTTKSLIRAAYDISDNVKLPLYIDEGFTVAEGSEIISNTESETDGLMFRLGLAETKPEGFDGLGYKFPKEHQDIVLYARNPLMIVHPKASGSKLQWNTYLNFPAFCSKFSDITLLAACYEDTLQYHALQSAGIKQVSLDWGLATEHVTKGSVNIAYVLENSEWRTTRKARLTDAQLEDIMLTFEREHWDEFINVKKIGDGGITLSVKSHGFNDYSKVHHFMDLHTQMPIPSTEKFYREHLGMNQSDIRKACYHYDRYQGALRTSIRNSKHNDLGTEDLYYCFGDKATAEYFASKLAPWVNKRVYKLPIDLEIDTEGKATYSNKVSDNKAEQKARSRDRTKLTELTPSLNKLDEALIYLRDFRRKNPNKRITKAIYQQVVKEFS